MVDDQGRLVGIVSRANLLQVFIRSDDSIAREVRDDVILGTLRVDPDQVQVGVVDGVVRLEGEVEARSPARILTCSSMQSRALWPSTIG